MLQKVKTFLFYSANLTDCFFLLQKVKRLVSSLQKVKTFFFYSANLTDCFFAAENEEIVSLLQKVKRLFLCCRK